MESVPMAALKAARVFTSQAFKRAVELMRQRRGIPGQQPADRRWSNSELRFWHRTVVVFPRWAVAGGHQPRDRLWGGGYHRQRGTERRVGLRKVYGCSRKPL